jgi:hypothetical protein
MTLNPAPDKRVGYADFQIIVGNRKPGRIPKPDTMLLLTYPFSEKLIDCTYLIRDCVLHKLFLPAVRLSIKIKRTY